MADTREIKERKARLKHLKDTTANWERANPILLDGEMGIEDKGNGKLATKMGDGITPWNRLPYYQKPIAEVEAENERNNANLQNQIDNIVLTATGDGDAAAEVAQARVDANGTNYPTLKERLDAEQEVLLSKANQTDVDVISESLINSSLLTKIEWEQGGLTQGVENDLTATRIRTNYIKVAKGSVISVDKTKVKYSLHFYTKNEDKSYTFLKTNPITDEDFMIEKDSYVRICFARHMDSTLDIDVSYGQYLDVSKIFSYDVAVFGDDIKKLKPRIDVVEEGFEKITDACCNKINVYNYNLFKMSEVSYSSRLQDDTEGIIASTYANFVTGWIPVSKNKYYTSSLLFNGERTTYIESGKTLISRVNFKKADGSVIVGLVGNGDYGYQLSNKELTTIKIQSSDISHIQVHYNLLALGVNLSTVAALSAIEFMITEGSTAIEAQDKAINLPYYDGDKDIIGVEYELKQKSGRLVIPDYGAVIGTLFNVGLVEQYGDVNTNMRNGIVTDYIHCFAGSTVTVDSDDYAFQVMEYSEIGKPSAYSGVLNYGSTYITTKSGYVRLGVRYVDDTLYADKSTLTHLVTDLTGYYDIDKIQRKVFEINKSPYYRNVNFGVVPRGYFRGLSDSYSTEGFTKDTTYAEYISKYKALILGHETYVTETALGTASDGQTIYSYHFKPVRWDNEMQALPKVMIFAGQHGTEKCNVFGWYYFTKDLLNNWHKSPELEYLRHHVELIITPIVNTYGFDNNYYKNANDVNINRNYSSNWTLVEDTESLQYGSVEPFDQPESQLVRNLILSNSDNCVLVIDSHVNNDGASKSWEELGYYGHTAKDDEYYNRIRNALPELMSRISSNFNVDYNLNAPDTCMGFLNTDSGHGILRTWVSDNDIIGVLIEGFSGFYGGTAFAPEVFKANEEQQVNWLITALNYLSK